MYTYWLSEGGVYALSFCYVFTLIAVNTNVLLQDNEWLLKFVFGPCHFNIKLLQLCPRTVPVEYSYSCLPNSAINSGKADQRACFFFH